MLALPHRPTGWVRTLLEEQQADSSPSVLLPARARENPGRAPVGPYLSPAKLCVSFASGTRNAYRKPTKSSGSETKAYRRCSTCKLLILNHCTGPSLSPLRKAISQMPLPVAAGRKVGKVAADWPAAVAFAPKVPVFDPVVAIPTVSRNWRVNEKPVNGGMYFDHWPK